MIKRLLLAALALAISVGAVNAATPLYAVPVNVSSIELTSAQIKTGLTVPTTFISGTTGYTIVLLDTYVRLNYGAATYSSTACGLYYHGTTQLANSTNFNTTVDAAATSMAILPSVAAGAIAVANTSGKDVDFACTTGDPTTGDGTLKITAAWLAIPN